MRCAFSTFLFTLNNSHKTKSPSKTAALSPLTLTIVFFLRPPHALGVVRLKIHHAGARFSLPPRRDINSVSLFKKILWSRHNSPRELRRLLREVRARAAARALPSCYFVLAQRRERGALVLMLALVPAGPRDLQTSAPFSAPDARHPSPSSATRFLGKSQKGSFGPGDSCGIWGLFLGENFF